MRIGVLGIFLVAAFTQFTVLDSVRVWGIKPDLVMILVIFYAFFGGRREGAFWGFIAGLLLDAATGSYFGLNALVYMVAGYLAGVVQTALYKDNPYVVSLVTLLVCLFTGLLHYLLLLYLGIFISPGVALLKITFCGAVYNALTALLLYRWFFRGYTKVYR